MPDQEYLGDGGGFRPFSFLLVVLLPNIDICTHLQGAFYKSSCDSYSFWHGEI
jgi:hypothetical protein